MDPSAHNEAPEKVIINLITAARMQTRSLNNSNWRRLPGNPRRNFAIELCSTLFRLTFSSGRSSKLKARLLGSRRRRRRDSSWKAFSRSVFLRRTRASRKRRKKKLKNLYRRGSCHFLQPLFFFFSFFFNFFAHSDPRRIFHVRLLLVDGVS